MKTILVNCESETSSLFQSIAEEFSNVKINGIFESTNQAINYVKSQEVDLAVISSGISGEGIALGKQLQQIKPEILLIYMVESETNITELLKLRAVAYLLQPYTAEDMLYAVKSADLQYRLRNKRIFAKTFGHFDLFVDGRPIIFKSAKAKELLALLIDRQGGVVDSDQIISTLWEGRPKDEATQSLCSKLCKTLYEELKGYGIEDLLIVSRGHRSVNMELFCCDLYEMLEGKEEAAMSYYGEYMKDYEWAEYRNYSLSKYV